jgi:hypothetical protein
VESPFGKPFGHAKRAGGKTGITTGHRLADLAGRPLELLQLTFHHHLHAESRFHIGAISHGGG